MLDNLFLVGHLWCFALTGNSCHEQRVTLSTNSYSLFPCTQTKIWPWIAMQCDFTRNMWCVIKKQCKKKLTWKQVWSGGNKFPSSSHYGEDTSSWDIMRVPEDTNVIAQKQDIQVKFFWPNNISQRNRTAFVRYNTIQTTSTHRA